LQPALHETFAALWAFPLISTISKVYLDLRNSSTWNEAPTSSVVRSKTNRQVIWMSHIYSSSGSEKMLLNDLSLTYLASISPRVNLSVFEYCSTCTRRNNFSRPNFDKMEHIIRSRNLFHVFCPVLVVHLSLRCGIMHWTETVDPFSQVFRPCFNDKRYWLH